MGRAALEWAAAAAAAAAVQPAGQSIGARARHAQERYKFATNVDRLVKVVDALSQSRCGTPAGGHRCTLALLASRRRRGAARRRRRARSGGPAAARAHLTRASPARRPRLAPLPGLPQVHQAGAGQRGVAGGQPRPAQVPLRHLLLGCLQHVRVSAARVRVCVFVHPCCRGSTCSGACPRQQQRRRCAGVLGSARGRGRARRGAGACRPRAAGRAGPQMRPPAPPAARSYPFLDAYITLKIPVCVVGWGGG